MCVPACMHKHQNLKYASTELKINRMALVKIMKHRTPNLLFKNALLPEVGIRESSWYEEQCLDPCTLTIASLATKDGKTEMHLSVQ